MSPKAKGRQQIERGLADMGVVPERSTYTPDRAECRPESYYVDLMREGRIFVSQWYDMEHRVADFVVVQEVNVAEPGEEEIWSEVLRVDNCHSETHAHYFDQDGNEIERRVLQLLETRADVDKGLDLAEDLVFEQWEGNLRRWRDGR